MDNYVCCIGCEFDQVAFETKDLYRRSHVGWAICIPFFVLTLRFFFLIQIPYSFGTVLDVGLFIFTMYFDRLLQLQFVKVLLHLTLSMALLLIYYLRLYSQTHLCHRRLTAVNTLICLIVILYFIFCIRCVCVCIL